VRRLLPGPPTPVDPLEAYADTPPDWLRIGMVMSLDGSVTDEDGWPDRLGSPADLRVFRTLRALADGIMVGAATVRTGRMGPHRPPPHLRERRQRDGKPPTAPIIVVSRSLRLDWSHRLCTEAAAPTIVVTCSAAVRRPPAAPVRLVVAGTDRVDLVAAVAQLRSEYGLRHLICEGGPTLATDLVNAGLVDELCLTIAPTLLGAAHHTQLLGDVPQRREVRLAALYEDGGTLLTRYQGLRPGTGAS